MTRLVVLGGGAAGFFGAIRAAELGCDVTLLEATGSPLQKVLISGGGRCNVTNATFDPVALVQHYPRGAKELRGVYSRFQPRDTMQWFEARGVTLKTEDDLRVFPATDQAQTIVDCLLKAASDAGVRIRTRASTQAIAREGDAYRVTLKDAEEIGADRVLLATGSNPQGLALARALGHSIVPPVPALFSLVVRDPRIDGLAGVAVPHVRATLACEGLAKPITKEGPLLVTHQGLSAHAILRLSSWAARELAATDYRATLTIDFAPDGTDDEFREACEDLRREHPRGTLGANPVVDHVPRRLWDRLLVASGLDPESRWNEAPRAGLAKLLAELKRGRYESSGRGDFREEIVTCGGVKRDEVDWRTMESRLSPGLHLAGEILDVDALTGGFNFQAAWSEGYLAGSAIGQTETSSARRRLREA